MDVDKARPLEPTVVRRHVATCNAASKYVLVIFLTQGLLFYTIPHNTTDTLNTSPVSIFRWKSRLRFRYFRETNRPQKPQQRAKRVTFASAPPAAHVVSSPEPHNTMPAHSTSFEDMTFTEPRTVLFAVGQKESIDTKLSWRWARDQFILPSDQIWLVHTRKKQSGWIPLDSVKVRRRPLSSTPCSQQFPFREER